MRKPVKRLYWRIGGYERFLELIEHVTGTGVLLRIVDVDSERHMVIYLPWDELSALKAAIDELLEKKEVKARE